MGIIKVLPEIVANKIAAGEVVERPASIVKELIENALDAGAKSIEIVIRHGGKSLIRVADDGSGMSAEDAEIAFQRHATSKVYEAEDLERIGSYGFRGEALPSIAAVSRVKMVSHKKGEREGTEVMIEGGKKVYVKPVSAAPGTVIEVRDLFFNTPARRKFMRTDATEAGHIADTIGHLALSRLEVRFSFKSSEKMIFDLLPVSDLKERTVAILGEETAKHLLGFQGEGQGVQISGVIGKPALSRANRLGQSFFVNRRWVKSMGLSYALQDGYQGRMMHGQYPVGVLFLEVDLARVDVNVHPTKQEVRIAHEAQIKSLLRDLVAKRLAQDEDLAPQARLGRKEFLGVSKQHQGIEELSATFSAAEMNAIYGVTERPQGFQESLFLPVHVQNAESLPEPIVLPGKLRITKILGQIHQTFILAETGEGFVIVDQHAAHERVQYEALLKNLDSGSPARQRLLIDEIVELSLHQSELIKDSLPFLNQLGFEVDEFGSQAFVIRAVPAVLAEMNPGSLIKNYLEEKEEGKLNTQLEHRKAEVAALIACKRKSVKAHDPLGPEFMKRLLGELSACENPFNCPHGRPTFLKHTLGELEKQFKRKL